MPTLDWGPLVFAAVCVLALCAIVVAWLQYRRARRWRIAAKEADAWADEYQRECAAMVRQVNGLAGENRQLRESRAALQDLVALRTRQLLAVNHSFIAYNVRRKSA